jgi:serine/threonine protein kinase
VNTPYLPADVLEAIHGAAENAASSVISYEFNLLHFACWGKAPAGTLQETIRLAPQSPSQVDQAKRLPLHFGASSKAAMEVLLAASPPDALRVKSTSGKTPLHEFLFHWDPKVEAFEAMLSKDKMTANILDDDDATPLHIACGYVSGEEKDRKPRKLAVISALLEAYPAATLQKSKAFGYLPLHVACKYRASSDIIGVLLAKGKGSEKLTDKALSLPLHLALAAGAPQASSAALLKAHPAAASIMDANGRLPLHLALAPTSGANAPEDLVWSIFELHPAAARARDNEDLEPLSRLQKRIKDTGSSGAYSGELIGKILLQCLPFDPATGEARAGEEPCFVWHKVLADCDDKLVAGVQEVLRLIPERVEALAFSLDEHGRRAIDRATPRCKSALIKRLFLCGRFEFKPGPPEHVSSTSIVRFATDYAKEASADTAAAAAAAAAAAPTTPSSPRAAPLPSEGGGLSPSSPTTAAAAAAAAAAGAAAPSTELPLVCLKFLKHRENFQRELDSRHCALHGATSPDHIVPVLAAYDGTADEDFARELEARGYASHPYLLVFPAGDRSLSAVIDHERESRDWEAEVRKCARALAEGLAHLHARGLIHGDVKPRNIVRIGRHNQYKLIDLDASTRIGDAVGIKTSTALAPPELLVVGGGGGARRGGTAPSPPTPPLTCGCWAQPCTTCSLAQRCCTPALRTMLRMRPSWRWRRSGPGRTRAQSWVFSRQSPPARATCCPCYCPRTPPCAPLRSAPRSTPLSPASRPCA